MDNSEYKIVVIHDGLIKGTDPLLIELRNEFGQESVVHIENSNQGLDYVLKNLSQKMIVLLDINFSHGELSGIQVFENIKTQTALVSIIMITARMLSEINHEDLVRMINHDAFAIENVFHYPEIVELVKTAAHKMEVRVDSALEHWILLHPESEINKPYIITRDGKSLSLKEILGEIRQQTPYGRDVEKKILMLAIDMLGRGKKQING